MPALFTHILSAIAVFVAALLLAAFAVPRIIQIAATKNLYDLPDNSRKVHKKVVPNLGGIGIFFAYIIVSSLAVDPAHFSRWTYISSATLILFFTGAKDDLVSMSPSKKFLLQAIAATIVVFFADLRIHSFYGLFGIEELPVWMSQLFTIVGCIFVTNAFNLLDGIDALAGTVSLLACLILGTVFFLSGAYNEAFVAFSMGGAVSGFLIFNKPPARIFMGDTGALVIGFTLSVLCILLIEQADVSTGVHRVVHSPVGALLLSLAVLFVPLFDTFRIFTVRIIKGGSPFKADRTHLHHYLLDLGLSHGRAVVTILTANAFILLVAYLLQDINPHMVIVTMTLVSISLFGILFYMRQQKVEPTVSRMRRRARILIRKSLKTNRLFVSKKPISR